MVSAGQGVGHSLTLRWRENGPKYARMWDIGPVLWRYRCVGLRMIEEIGTATMEVALLAAFTFILGASALILWDYLRGRMRGWVRFMAVVAGAAACALAATVISVGVGWAAAVTFGPDEPSPGRTEQTTPQNQERTTLAEGRDPETTTERSASSTASPTALSTASPTALSTASATALSTASSSPSP
jgi:hypothetical protein